MGKDWKGRPHPLEEIVLDGKDYKITGMGVTNTYASNITGKVIVDLHVECERDMTPEEKADVAP